MATWGLWVDCTAATGTAVDTNLTWTAWTATASTANTTEPLWAAWTATASGNAVVNVAPPPPETPEQRAAREERQAEAARLHQERKERAAALLFAHLNARQRREFREHSWFHVKTADGQRRYRIEYGTAGNVKRIVAEGGRTRVDRTYCIHPHGGFPAEDVMLAQKLMLETDEEQFLAIANAS